MHCDGKCQLMKKILEQQKNEQGPAPEIKFAGKAEVLLAGVNLITVIAIGSKRKYPSLNSSKLPRIAPAIFHPPPALILS